MRQKSLIATAVLALIAAVWLGDAKANTEYFTSIPVSSYSPGWGYLGMGALHGAGPAGDPASCYLQAAIAGLHTRTNGGWTYYSWGWCETFTNAYAYKFP